MLAGPYGFCAFLKKVSLCGLWGFSDIFVLVVVFIITVSNKESDASSLL